jgi:two-component system chemotaxis response regulator CheY
MAVGIERDHLDTANDRKASPVRALIVEDDFTSRFFLQKVLSRYGEVDTAVNGVEGVEAFEAAIARGRAYDLICMDIMMPEMDGQTALAKIRELEASMGIPWKNHVKIVMTTALGGIDAVMAAFHGMCDAYLTKPIDTVTLGDRLRTLRLVA